MNWFKYLIFSALIALQFLVIPVALTLKPVPADRADYVGLWENETTKLRISPDGFVVYKKLNGKRVSGVIAPIKKFTADSFSAGVGPISTSIIVNDPPRQFRRDWIMTVEGEKLTKSPNGESQWKPNSTPANDYPVLYFAAWLVAFISGLWVLIRAFKVHILWGLASLLIPYAVFVFAFIHWDEVKKPFILSLLATAFALYEMYYVLLGVL